MCKNSLYMMPAVFVLVLTVLCACGSAATAAPTAAVISLPTVAPITVATQAPANQNTGSGTGSGSIQWPSQMPTDVPVFAYGTITGSNNNIMGNIQGAFDNVPMEAFTKYQSDLKTAGWTITVATQSTSGFEIDATKGARTLVAMFVSTQKTGLTGAVTYNGHGS